MKNEKPKTDGIELNDGQRLELLFHEIRAIIQRRDHALRQVSAFAQEQQAKAESLRRQLEETKPDAS